MKKKVIILTACAVYLILLALGCQAADTDPSKPLPVPAKSWIESFSVAPVGALKTEHLDGPSQWGAGFDIGYKVNLFVSVHVLNLSFEGPGKTTTSHETKHGFETFTTGEDRWGGLLVDETDVQVDAKIAKFSGETFSLHLVGGAQTDWNDNNWGVNVGPKLALDFNKNLGVSVGYSVRTWFKGQTMVDSLATAQFNISF
jgi:hypothetical protein